MLPILDKLCHNLADWTVWQFWDQIVTPILTIHASDLALWGRYNLSRLSALNPNNKKKQMRIGIGISLVKNHTPHQLPSGKHTKNYG